MSENKNLLDKLHLLGTAGIVVVLAIVGISGSYAMMRGYLPGAQLNPLTADASTQTGVVQVIHYDNMVGKTTKKECIVKTENGKKIPFPGKCDHSIAGSRVRINGSSVQILSNAAHKTRVTGNKRVAVIPFNFNFNQTEPFSKADMEAVITSGSDSVNNYYKNSSYNQLSITATVFDWTTVTVPNTNTCEDGYQGALLAKAQISGNFDHYVFVFPGINGCIYGGWATLSGTDSWINGNASKYVWAHELGHNFGAMHASLLRCGPTQINVPNCGYDEYGDQWSVMGNNYSRMDNYHVLQLGWMSQGSTKTIQRSNSEASYTLNAIEQSSGIRDLIIPLDNGSKYSYHLEYRCCEPYSQGVIVRLGYDDLTDIRNTLLINTKYGGSVVNAPLYKNQTYHDTINGIKLSVSSITETSATVKVKFTSKKPQVDIKISTIEQAQYGNFFDDTLVAPAGTAVTAKWSTNNVKTNSCKIKPTNWDFSQGKFSFTAATSTKYTLTCKDLDNNEISDSVQLKIGTCTRSVPTMTIQPTNKTVAAGTKVTYKLKITNKDSADCTSTIFNFSGNTPQELTQTPLSFDNISLKPGESATKEFKIKSFAQTAPGTYRFGEYLNSNFQHYTDLTASYTIQ